MYLGYLVPVVFLIILVFTLPADCQECSGKLCNNELKLLYVSDIHLNPFYDNNIDANFLCYQSADANYSAAYEAPYGRTGCNSPEELLTITLAGMKEKGSDAKLMIFSGIELDCFASVSSLKTKLII